ncbi:MAG: RluA family pseudouridine synthase [Syntrophaceae bacterium]
MSDLQCVISESDSGKRLDIFLAAKESSLSRSQIKRMIEDGSVLVNGKNVKAGYSLKRGDSVSLTPKEPVELETLPQDLPLKILFEDSSIVVVDKPAGMVVHPAAGNYDGTLVNAILYHCRGLSGIGGVIRPGIVHRLDKDTSGLIVVAKTDEAHRELSDQFKKHLVTKVYYAFAFGNFKEDEGVIEAAVGRHPVDRKKMSVYSRRGKEALTRWKVVERYGFLSFLEIRIETGRTHQIRVHLNSIGHPILGDNIYGNSAKRLQAIQDTKIRSRLKSLKRHALHAGRLAFAHPRTHEKVEFEAPLPEDMEDLRTFLNEHIESKYRAGN